MLLAEGSVEAMHDLRKVMQTCSTLCAQGLRLKLLSKAEREFTVHSDPILFFITSLGMLMEMIVGRPYISFVGKDDT